MTVSSRDLPILRTGNRGREVNPDDHQFGNLQLKRLQEVFGNYDEKTRQFELKAEYPMAGDVWHQRTVIQPMLPQAMVVASYLSFGKVPEWKGVEIKYTRKGK